MRRRSRLTSVSTLRTVTKVSPRQIFASSASRLNTMPGVRREQVQQPELLIGQLDVAAVDPHAAPRQIDVDAVDADRRSGRLFVAVESPAPRSGAAAAAARAPGRPARARRTAWSGSRRRRSRGRRPCPTPRAAPSASGSARRGSCARCAPRGTATRRRGPASSRRAPADRSARPRCARAPSWPSPTPSHA